jgi:hypothetical protein
MAFELIEKEGIQILNSRENFEAKFTIEILTTKTISKFG